MEADPQENSTRTSEAIAAGTQGSLYCAYPFYFILIGRQTKQFFGVTNKNLETLRLGIVKQGRDLVALPVHHC